MKKLIIMLMLGFIGQAQTFDFDCGPFPAEIITFEIRATGFDIVPKVLVRINGRIPTDGLRGRTAFLNEVKGLVLAVDYSLSNETQFFIVNIGLENLLKLETKFNNKEPIYLDIN